MNWLKRTVFIILVMGIASSWQGLAEGQDQAVQSSQVGQTDIKKGCERRFNLLDKDGNGEVTLDEFSASRLARGRRAEQYLQRSDLDGNGVLTKEEFCAGKAARRAAGKMPGPAQPQPSKVLEPQGKGTTQ